MDHIADLNDVELFELASRFDLPSFVKNAVIDRTSTAALPSSSFADSSARLFPCHTRADTFLSYMYFLKHANDVPDFKRASVFNRLQQFARDWAIYADCKRLQTEHEKQAADALNQLPDDDFVIVEEIGGEIYRALPVTDVSGVKQAEDHLIEYRDRYPADWRRRAAQRLAAKAAALQTEVSEYVRRAANTLTSPSVDVATSLLHRAHLVSATRRSEPEYSRMLKLAQALAERRGPVADSDAVMHAIDSLDRHFDLTRMYVRHLPTPEEVVYGAVMSKTAARVVDSLVPLTTGNVYAKSALLRHGVEPYRVFGDDFVSSVTNNELELDREKVAQIVATLPRSDAELLERALHAVGERPVAAALKNAQIGACNEWSAQDWQRVDELVNV